LRTNLPANAYSFRLSLLIKTWTTILCFVINHYELAMASGEVLKNEISPRSWRGEISFFIGIAVHRQIEKIGITSPYHG